MYQYFLYVFFFISTERERSNYVTFVNDWYMELVRIFIMLIRKKIDNEDVENQKIECEYKYLEIFPIVSLLIF